MARRRGAAAVLDLFAVRYLAPHDGDGHHAITGPSARASAALIIEVLRVLSAERKMKECSDIGTWHPLPTRRDVWLHLGFIMDPTDPFLVFSQAHPLREVRCM